MVNLQGYEARQVRTKVSILEIVGLIVLLPGLTYGAGYLMWVAPSRQLYGRNLASAVGVAGLLEPGVIYVAAIAFASVFAAVVGMPRIFTYSRPRRRAWRLVIDLALGVVISSLIGISAQLAAARTPSVALTDPAGSSLYLVAHVVVLGLVIRKLWGLVGGSVFPPPLERRQKTPIVRVLEGLLVLVLLSVQVPMVLLFGALGPNPAKRVTPVDLTLISTTSSENQLEYVTCHANLISVNSEFFLVFDRDLHRITEIPRTRVQEIRWE